ncbi:hypothetical protein T01_5112 [Trichinella spiralis]|uniref:Uncharacterized protein n=1 Tax=Trichinella spiralis TaxID=6334 RepID=A0A0V0YVT0_TRISP|nr:hypothetical protein T01_5112 [Trichinella spiralis]
MTRKPFDQLMNALPLEGTEPAVGIDFDSPILPEVQSSRASRGYNGG